MNFVYSNLLKPVSWRAARIALLISSGEKSSRETAGGDLFPYLGLEAKARSPNILWIMEKDLSDRDVRPEMPWLGPKLLNDRVSIKGVPWMQLINRLRVRTTRKTRLRIRDIFFLVFSWEEVIDWRSKYLQGSHSKWWIHADRDWDE